MSERPHSDNGTALLAAQLSDSSDSAMEMRDCGSQPSAKLDVDIDETEAGFDELSLERYAPVGAAAADPEPERYRTETDETDQLNISLLSLTSHFAQVQFRLKQICAAPPEEREAMLRDLEAFAHRGCPDMSAVRPVTAGVETQRKQKELIQQLKEQLEDVEKLAYETGTTEELPTSTVLEKQRVIMEELRDKMDLDIGVIDRLTRDELKEMVNEAVGKIVNPGKVKEQLLYHMQTQIVDLEAFIEFLKVESNQPRSEGASVALPGNIQREGCVCPVHSPVRDREERPEARKRPRRSLEDHAEMVRRALAVMQIYVTSHFGCVSQFRDRVPAPAGAATGTPCDGLVNKLRDVVSVILELQEIELRSDSDYTSDSSDTPVIHRYNVQLVRSVRKELATTLRDILGHGLVRVSESRTLIAPLSGCFVHRGVGGGAVPSGGGSLHPWELFLKYYEAKNGEKFNKSPARKLSQSFRLDIVGGSVVTSKQMLLTTIHSILSSHTPYGCSNDTQWKAFVCHALNAHKLSVWCRLVSRCQSLVETYYTSWSYVNMTGLDPVCTILERLSSQSFSLPADVAVRPYNTIRDAF